MQNETPEIEPSEEEVTQDQEPTSEDLDQTQGRLVRSLSLIFQELLKLLTLLPRTVWRLLRLVVNISNTTDVPGTISSIKEGVELQGYNIWILVASAILACIGLNTNSEAVVIGAMLISPLMSPILGIGLSVGINDRNLLKDAVRNFLIAVGVSLFAATVYFIISPLRQPTEQLDARTHPTLLDIGIAFFGGVAGIVAGSRKKVTNAIPGVAIATALMPPLCTAGFGLAHLNMNYFLNAIYLFFLNTVFISLSTYLIVKFLKFPTKEQVDPRTAKRVKWYVIGFVVLISIPSAYLLIPVVLKERREARIDAFVAEAFPENHRLKVMDVDYQDAPHKDSLNVLYVTLAGDHYPEKKADSLNQVLQKRGFRNTVLDVVSTGFDTKKLDDISVQNQDAIAKYMKLLKLEEDEKKNEIEQLKEQINALKADTLEFGGIASDLKSGFPEIQKLALSELRSTSFEGKEDTIPVLMVHWQDGIPRSKRREFEERLQGLVRSRIHADTLLLYNY